MMILLFLDFTIHVGTDQAIRFGAACFVLFVAYKLTKLDLSKLEGKWAKLKPLQRVANFIGYTLMFFFLVFGAWSAVGLLQ
jgi:hypothetical protein